MARLQDPEPLAEELNRKFESLRAEHGLREVTAEDEGTGVDKLPAGVYGFTYSPAEENFPLFRSRELRSYETHKRADGSVILLGFLTETEKRAFETAPETTTISLFPEPQGDVDQLVEVPMSRVVSHVEYSQRGGQGLQLSVGPAQ